MTASTRFSIPGVMCSATHKMLGYLQDAAIHGEVVLAGRDYQIRPSDEAVLVDLVMMEERAARSLGRRLCLPVLLGRAKARTCWERISGSVSNCSRRSTQYRISMRRAKW